jgi:hypothetical protein
MIATRAISHLPCLTPHDDGGDVKNVLDLVASRVNMPNECKDNTHRPKGAMQGFTEDIQ